MSGHGGPKLTRDSLALAIDAKQTASTRADTNILASYPWKVGTGSETFYGQNGDGNSRVIGTNPFGQQAVLWQTLNNDATSDADGGWNTSSFPIDNTKTYRYSVWVKREVLGNGSFYLGCHGYGTTTGVTSNDSSAWAANTNPYFVSTGWPRSTSVWYLVVGHIFPHNWTTLGDHPDSGWYEVNNPKKLADIDDRDYRWHSTTTSANYRTYLYYSTNSSTHQLWYAPRIDLCDGTEPSIAELVTVVGNQQDTISGESINNYNAIKDSNGYYIFDGTGTSDGVTPGSYLEIPENTTDTRNYPNGCTYSFWMNVDADAPDRMSLFFGSSTINHIEIYSASKYFRTEAAKQNGKSFGSGVFPNDVRDTWSKFDIVFATDETGCPVRWYQDGKLFYTGYLQNGTYADEYFSFNKIGRSTGTTTYLYAPSFKGKITHFYVYDKKMDPKDIKRNVAAFRRRFK